MSKDSIKKISAMYGTSMLAIVLGFLVSIFNSRVLGPENFGDFKFIQTVGGFIASLVSVGLFISLTRLLAINKDKAKEKKYTGLFILVFITVSIIGMLLMFLFSFVEPNFFGHGLDKKFKIFLFIIPVTMGLAALKEILKGMHRIYALSILGFLPALAYLTLIFPLSKYVPIDLDHVLFASYGTGFLIVTYYMIKLKPDFGIKKFLAKRLLVENRQNGRPVYYGTLAGVATEHVAGFSISHFMDNTQVGFFMLALTICSPMLMIPSVMGTVFFKQFATIHAIPKKVFYFTLISTIAALFIFYALVEMVILTFYSEDYLAVSNISKLLIIAFIFHGLGDLFNRFLGAKGKGKLLRNAAYLVGIVNVLGYWILVKLFDLNGAILTKIMASGTYMIVMYVYYVSLVRTEKKSTI